jgi:hypothetical protein
LIQFLKKVDSEGLPHLPNHKAFGYVLAFIFIIILFFGGIRVVQHLQTPLFSDDEKNWGLMDYQNTTYYPVLAFLEGVNPYDYQEYISNYPVDASFPVYSPLTLLIHLPFGMLPFGASSTVYFFFNAFLMVVVSWLILHVAHVEKSLASVLLLTILIVLSRPGWMVLLCGQIICEVTIGTIVALHYSRTKPFLSGCGLALACLKPTFGIPLAALMIFRRDYRSVMVGASLSIVGAVSAIILIEGSVSGVVDFFAIIWNQHVSSENVLGLPPPSYFMRIDALSVVSRLLNWNPGTKEMITVFIAFIAGSGIVVRRVGSTGDFTGANNPVAALIVTTMISCIYHMEYDALILFLPLVAFVFSFRWKIVGISRFLWWSTVCALVFFLFNPLTTKTARNVFGLDETSQGWVGTLDGLLVLFVLFASAAIAERVHRRDVVLEGPLSQRP